MFGLFPSKRRKAFERVVIRAHCESKPPEAAPSEAAPTPEDVPYLLGVWDALTPTQRRACLVGEPVPPMPTAHEDIAEGVLRISVPGGWIYFKASDEVPVVRPHGPAPPAIDLRAGGRRRNQAGQLRCQTPARRGISSTPSAILNSPGRLAANQARRGRQCVITPT